MNSILAIMDNLNHCNTLLIQISVNDTTCIISKFFFRCTCFQDYSVVKKSRILETGKMITISQLKLFQKIILRWFPRNEFHTVMVNVSTIRLEQCPFPQYFLQLYTCTSKYRDNKKNPTNSDSLKLIIYTIILSQRNKRKLNDVVNITSIKHTTSNSINSKLRFSL